MKTTIVRVSVSSFAAGIAVASDTSLKGKPFVISSASNLRAVVLDLSSEAQKDGITKGMSVKKASKIIPSLRIIPPSPELYKKADHIISDISGKFSPSIEFGSHGRFFIDISGTSKLWGSAIDTAAKIMTEIRNSIYLDACVGTASSKTVSEIASSVAHPYGLISVRHGSEKHFLAPQPVPLMPGIGPVISERLSIVGINLMGELAGISDRHCIKLLGSGGIKFKEKASGIDTEPLFTEHARKPSIRSSIINQTDPESLEEAMMILLRICEDTGFQMRELDLSAMKVSLNVAFSDGLVRSGSLESTGPLWSDMEIFHFASLILRKIKEEKRTKIRILTLDLSKLSTSHYQVPLFTPPSVKAEHRLQETMDHLKKRFGMDSVRKAPAFAAPE